MMRYRSEVVKVSILVIMLLCLDDGILRADTLKEQFIREGVSSLREMEDFSYSLQALIQADAPMSGADHHFFRECLLQGPWRLVTLKTRMDRISESQRARYPVEVISGINSRYAFTLRRQSPEAPYAITHFAKARTEQAKAGPNMDFFSPSLFSTWILRFRPFHEWLKMGSFSIESVTPMTSPSNGRTFVKVKVKHVAKNPAKWIRDADASFDADVVLDPENHWAICSTQCIIHLTGNIHVKADVGEYSISQRMNVEFGSPVDGMPIPKTVTDVVDWPKDSKNTSSTTSVYFISNVQKARGIGESHFMLSRFGLSEMNLDWQKPEESNIAYWLIGLGIPGILLAALAFVFVRRKLTYAAATVRA